jgi:hypothetical protein
MRGLLQDLEEGSYEGRQFVANYVFFFFFFLCLDCVKNNVGIEELRIANEDSEKLVIFQFTQG